MPLTCAALAALRHIVQGDPKRLFSFRVDPQSLEQLSGASEGYLLTQLERGFRSLDFYKGLRPSGGAEAGKNLDLGERP